MDPYPQKNACRRIRNTPLTSEVQSPAEPEVERQKRRGVMLKVMSSQLVSISTNTSFSRSLTMITLLYTGYSHHKQLPCQLEKIGYPGTVPYGILFQIPCGKVGTYLQEPIATLEDKF